MKVDSVAMERAIVPKRRQNTIHMMKVWMKRESLLPMSPVEIEREVPAEENEPVEGAEADNSAESPAFEE